MQKRMKKMELIEAEMEGPTRYGSEGADLTLLGWGSTCGPIQEAVERLSRKDIDINFFHFRDIWPFPADKAIAALSQARRMIAIENNYSGQFARLLRGSTGIEPHKLILKYDGRPFSTDQIIERLVEEEEIHG
jgi:2-oxoglutarate ferredoxin oxidoreductase subunit alpha